MTDADIEATKAPLMDHIIELRTRLIRALAAFIAMFLLCFFFAKDIFNLLVIPYRACRGGGRAADLHGAAENTSSRRSRSRSLLPPTCRAR